MRISKIVRIEVSQDDEGNTEVNIVFGLKGTRQNPWVHPAHPAPVPRFTETNRISLDWHDGQPFAFFDGWEIPLPTIHATETPEMAILEALEASNGLSRWGGYEYAPESVDSFKPSQGSFQSHHEA